MNNINLEKNILKVWFSLVLLASIAFAIAAIDSYTYLTGFLIGSLVSISIFFATNFFLGKLLSNKRTFKMGFLLSFLKFILTSCLLIGTLISIIFINKAFHKGDNSLSNIDGIFNFFTVLAGLFTIPTSIIFYQIWVWIYKNIKERKEKHGTIN
ncbi:MAG: hypothetical protein ACRC7B_02840 [Metamycoplasmataceae bacterium]